MPSTIAGREIEGVGLEGGALNIAVGRGGWRGGAGGALHRAAAAALRGRRGRGLGRLDVSERAAIPVPVPGAEDALWGGRGRWRRRGRVRGRRRASQRPLWAAGRRHCWRQLLAAAGAAERGAALHRWLGRLVLHCGWRGRRLQALLRELGRWLHLLGRRCGGCRAPPLLLQARNAEAGRWGSAIGRQGGGGRATATLHTTRERARERCCPPARTRT